jgi:hypothetical protein
MPKTKTPFEESQEDVRTTDPTSDLLKRIRKYLLLCSGLGVVMSKAGIVPSAITFFGLSTGEVDQSALLAIVWALILFFLTGFVVYTSMECARAKAKAGSRIRTWVWATTKWRKFLICAPQCARIFVDFIVPIGIGIYALFVVWQKMKIL